MRKRWILGLVFYGIFCRVLRVHPERLEDISKGILIFLKTMFFKVVEYQLCIW